MNFIVRSDLRFASRWLFAGLALMSVVMMVSLLPNRVEVLEVTYVDKVMHLVVFMGLMVFFCGFVEVQLRWLLVLFLLACGGLIEVLQIPVPGRAAEAADLMADMVGIMLGWLLAKTWFGNWTVWVENRRITS
jgi:VanZ family protein